MWMRLRETTAHTLQITEIENFSIPLSQMKNSIFFFEMSEIKIPVSK